MSDSSEESSSQESQSSSDAESKATSVTSASRPKSVSTQGNRINKRRKSKTAYPPVPPGKFQIPAHSKGKDTNPLRNWDPMGPPASDEETEKPVWRDPSLPLYTLAGKPREEQDELIRDYKAEFQLALMEHTAALEKHKRYEIRVRLDEYRRGQQVNCSTAEIKKVVEEIIETQRYNLEEP